jgi:tRNA A37 methylthiotransferase MiaB
MDISGKPQLFELLSQIEELPGDFRYRLLYLYPDLLSLHQLKKLTSFRKFIPYFDIPLQHSASSVLQRMGRFYDEKAISNFLQFIKTNFPVHFIRTNFIIGFPGESESEFQHLCSFIQQDYFDNISLFQYHDEPLAPSFLLPDKIPNKLIHARFSVVRSHVDELMLARSQARKGIVTR